MIILQETEKLVVYRALTADDADMILDMNRNFREDFVSRDSAGAFLSKKENLLFAAVSENTVIGFAFGYLLPRLDGGRTMLYLHEVGVMEAYQRQGIGFAMMTALKQWCKDNGIGKMFLTCYQNNIGANKLYKKAGGEVPRESQGEDTVYYFPIK